MATQNPGELDLHRTVLAPPGHVPAQASRIAVLIVLHGAQIGRRYLLGENGILIGRIPGRVDLMLAEDLMVSGLHCRIERGAQPDGWVLVDLGSRNGTYVGGTRVATTTLRDGDRIQLGETVLKFCLHDDLEDAFHRQVDQWMNIDDLTGLPVQRVYQQRLQHALQASAVASRPLAVYMMDMDGLKAINDRFGHHLGAHSIAVVGRRLGGIVEPAGGLVSRFGGDEFSAFVPGLDLSSALHIGETMRAAVADRPVQLGATTVHPTISIGVADFPEQCTLADGLTLRADEALYRAKAAGRNRVSP